jgi:hypothetical protein
MGILRDRMVEEMKLRNFSAATQESYLYAVARLTKHYRRSPDQLDREQIRPYLKRVSRIQVPKSLCYLDSMGDE